jgi:hypothetical protein
VPGSASTRAEQQANCGETPREGRTLRDVVLADLHRALALGVLALHLACALLGELGLGLLDDRRLGLRLRRVRRSKRLGLLLELGGLALLSERARLELLDRRRRRERERLVGRGEVDRLDEDKVLPVDLGKGD